MIAGTINTIAIVTNGAFSLSNFRGALIRRIVESGIQVFALAPDYNDETRAAVRALGAEPIDISLERTGMRPGRDLIDMVRLTKLFRQLRPDLVFSYFIKPVIYGSIAAWIAGVPRRYALVAGLGYVFTPDGSKDAIKRRILRFVAKNMYRISFSVCDKIFLQNEDDRNFFCDNSILKLSKVSLISGSGVDLNKFDETPLSKEGITFILVARLLREKGIIEYIDAARQIKLDHPNATFLLVGDLDENPGGLSLIEVARWVEEGIIEWPGLVPDVRPWITRSNVFVLPSYREGKPRSTQEAMAMGRPIITTDAPGCRDTVEEGVNGFKVPIRDTGALETAMRHFIENPTLIPSMGAESRRLAEERFDVHRINQTMLDVMHISKIN